MHRTPLWVRGKTSFLAVLAFAAGNALSFLALWYSLQAMLFSFLPFVAFGTGEGLLRYGIRIRCSKQAPGVRDAFSEAFGAKNRRFRYGRDIRYQKPPFLVRNRSLDAKKGHHRNNKKEQDKSCDLSCLVEQAIEISNSFINDYRLVCEFKFA